PVAGFLGELFPRDVDVDAEGGDDVAQILAVPGGWPGGDGAVAEGFVAVGDHGGFGGVVDAAEAVTGGAGAFGGVGGEAFGVDDRLRARVVAGAGVEHSE